MVLAACCGGSLLAQDAVQPPLAPPVQAATVIGPACPPSACIPALTPVKLIIREHVGSRISTGGQLFEIELAEPLMIGDTAILLAGTKGVGEVVHAKKSGGSGTPGELVLAARYLDFGGQHVRLRSMHFAEVGKDRMGTANAINIGAAASPIPGVGLIGFLVKGKDVDVPDGTVLDAKTAEPFEVAPLAQPPAAPPASCIQTSQQEGK